MRRINQDLILQILDAADYIARRYLDTARVTENLAIDLPPSAIREAIIQNVANAEFDIYTQLALFRIERRNIESTRPRNRYLKRLRDRARSGDDTTEAPNFSDLDLPAILPDPNE